MIRILKYEETSAKELFSRSEALSDVSETVRGIIAEVRERGDRAVLEYTERFDQVKLPALEVTKEEIDAAFEKLDPAFVEVLERAADNIRQFHACQCRSGFTITKENGIVLGQKVMPIERVGIYVPGGTAPLSSTVLMDAIPAKLAGCGLIVMATAPGKDGHVHPAILAAARVAGVDRIFQMGGAQAIAALSYGTESVPQVDKIVGPGNAFVAEAKRQVFGRVAIDMIAGPSEILAVADGKTNPVHMAADLLSQAEHDRNASAVLVTDSMDLALKVQAEIERQLPLLPREEIARTSIERNGKIIVTDRLLSAIEVANEIAPEHLELCVDQPFDYLGMIRHAGSVFLGRHCPEAVGDYYAGPNHTLPTGGTAKFSSPLSVDDFVKKTQYLYYPEEALRDAAEDIARFAEAEELQAHARSVLVRVSEESGRKGADA